MVFSQLTWQRIVTRSPMLLMLPLISSIPRISAQSGVCEWYGKGLTYLRLDDSTVLYTYCLSTDDIHTGPIDEITDTTIVFSWQSEFRTEPYHESIRLLNPAMDSVRMGKGVLYAPEHVPYGQEPHRYIFNEITLEYLEDLGGIACRIEFNRYGTLRVSNKKNETLLETMVDEKHVEEFRELIRYIDIRNLNESLGMQNMCLDNEYKFTFTDGYEHEESFRAMSMPVQLKPVRTFLEELSKHEGYTFEYAGRWR